MKKGDTTTFTITATCTTPASDGVLAEYSLTPMFASVTDVRYPTLLIEVDEKFGDASATENELGWKLATALIQRVGELERQIAELKKGSWPV